MFSISLTKLVQLWYAGVTIIDILLTLGGHDRRAAATTRPREGRIMAKLKMSFNDYSNEVSTAEIRGIDLTAGNFTAQTGLADDLADAILAVVKGQEVKREVVAYTTKTPKVNATDKDIQIERKWLVSGVDAVNGNPFSFSIPTADSAFVSNNTDLMDLAGTEGAALKAAIEAYARSAAGNAVTVNKIELVGRNT